jgi:D-aminoacyl-tRNA deacylase
VAKEHAEAHACTRTARPGVLGRFHTIRISETPLRLITSALVRAVVQRVRAARVLIGAREVAAVGEGLCVLLGVARDDGEDDARRLARRVARLRIFENEAGRFDRSLVDAGGSALVVSQFTLIANSAKGNRPSFTDAAAPERAAPLYETFCASLRAEGIAVRTGRFGARMVVELENDGPVTIVLDG